jgi:hypothetical protein
MGVFGDTLLRPVVLPDKQTDAVYHRFIFIFIFFVCVCE